MARRAIDLEGLPEEALKDVAAYVTVLLNVQPGTVYGDLTREDICDDER